MIDGHLYKSPTEKKILTADFSSEVPASDSIATATTGFTITTLAGVTSTSMTGSSSISGSLLLITLNGDGTDGLDYRVTATAKMTTAGTIFDKFFEVRVRTKVKV